MLVSLAFFGNHVAPHTPPAQAQLITNSPVYNTNAPHWSHITILDFGRHVQWLPYGATRTAGYEWYARHVDAMETISDRFYSQYGMTSSAYVKTFNPTIKTFTYDLDLSMCLHMDCNATSAVNSAQMNLPEDQYLHFSQDTTIQYTARDGVTILNTETIPGCPNPGALTSACRVKTYVWDDYRWIANVKNLAWREWFADHLIHEMAFNSNEQPNPVDAIFLDEHAPGFSLSFDIGYHAKILSGGGIREYGGLVPRDIVTSGYYTYNSLDALYNADVVDWLTYLRSRLTAIGKIARPNIAGHFMQSMGFQQAAAAGGVMTEHLHAADQFFGATQYQTFLNQVAQMSADGGSIDLAGSTCDTGPAGYTPGNYPSSATRFWMWNLSSYYLAKEPVGSSGRVYFNPNLCVDENSPTPLSFMDDWLLAYETNVGQPASDVSVIQTGSTPCASEGYKVFSRQYENARILVRPRGGPACADYSDQTAVQIPLEAPMVMLNPNGTFSAPMASISLRNAESVILFPAPDTTAPTAIGDLRAS